MKERILLGEGGPLTEVATQHLAGQDSSVDIVPLSDGARCIGAFTKLARVRKPPLMVVLSGPLDRVDVPGVALSIRAIERATGAEKATPLLLYTPEAADDDFKAFLKSLGRAVHLQRPVDQRPDEQGRRLANAVMKLLAQVRGK